MSSEILIIGGGPAGLSAAAALAQGGRSVVIVDRNEAPGGQTSNWCCLATDTCQRCGLCLLHDLQTTVSEAHGIRRITADVTSVVGTRGNFRATLGPTADRQDGDTTLESDTVVLATGFVPFDPLQGRPMGYGELDAVVTTVDVNRALLDDDLSSLGFAGGGAKRIAFLQCIGSRDPDAGRGYCSQVCCQGSLRAARALRHRHPDWQITVFYTDLQIYGKTARSRFAELAPRLRFVQGVPAEVLPDEDGAVRLAFQDTDGNMTQESFDGVVLAVGMVPSPGAERLAESLGVERGIGGFLDGDPPDGVYVAGTCTGPSFIEASLSAGRQAAGLLLRDASPCARRAAVIGRGDEGTVAAEALWAAGVRVSLVQLDRSATPPVGDGIEVVLADDIVSVDGQLGGFSLELANASTTDDVKADALVLAPGVVLAAQPSADLAQLPHQSLTDFVAALEGGTTPERVVLQLDPAGPAWRPAAATGIEAATRTIATGKSEVTVVFEHMPLPGLLGQRRYDDARRGGVRFLRKGGTPLRAGSGKEPALLLTDAAVPETPAKLPLDTLVVTEHLGTGTDTDADLATLAHRCGVKMDREGLAQGGAVRLFPMRTERPGIWVLGNARQEAGANTVRAEATSVAADVRALLTDDTRFNREAPAQIEKKHCVFCLTCVRICPHRAVTTQATSTPLISATACEQCGACVAACPGEAITLTPEAVPPEAISPTSAASEATVIFACSHSGGPALRAAKIPRQTTVREVACGGAVSELDMLRAYGAGAHRVILLSCHAGSCAHVSNHLPCGARAHLLAETVRRVGLPQGAFSHWTVAPAEGKRVTHLLATESQNGGAQ